MSRSRAGGFTLIELLTVVAIIAILASMVFVVGPRMIERAKITSFTNNCNQIRVACVSFFPKNHDSYPPGYGFKLFRTDEVKPEDPDSLRLNLTPYMSTLDMFKNFDMYDNFSQGTYDTDNDGKISLLEFYPVGIKSTTNMDSYDFPENVFRMDLSQSVGGSHGGRTFADEVREASQQQRPLVYVPINKKQYQKIADYYYKMANTSGSERRGWYMERWDHEALFPENEMTAPPKYDDYVLISVGPVNNTGGILTPPREFLADVQAKVEPDLWYNVLAIRAYWLATRDINENGKLDFDFRNRSRGEDADPKNYPGGASLNLNLLPDGSNGGGPLIYVPNT
jgi:prepilin-type N-terminal cleavage/methylation domain-containing protein